MNESNQTAIDRQKISDGINSLNDMNALDEGFAIAELIARYDALKARNAELESALLFAKDHIVAIESKYGKTAPWNPHHGGECPALKRIDAALAKKKQP